VERMTRRGAQAEIVEIDLAESGIPLPLGWSISDATRRSMRDSLAPANYCASEEARRRAASLPARQCGYDRIAELMSPEGSGVITGLQREQNASRVLAGSVEGKSQ
jgi:hypothetical protein